MGIFGCLGRNVQELFLISHDRLFFLLASYCISKLNNIEIFFLFIPTILLYRDSKQLTLFLAPPLYPG